jgi:hypothetical protein
MGWIDEFKAELEAIRKAGSHKEAEIIEEKIIRKAKMGRPKGTKNFRGRLFNERDLLRFFGGIAAVQIGSTIKQHYRTIDDIANALLDRVVADAEFFDYTGNLTGSFSATVVRNRKIVNRFFYHNKVKYGIIGIGKKGGRFTRKRNMGVHKSPAAGRNYFTTSRRKIMDIRYLKRWEKERGGYGPRTIHSPKRKSGFGESPRLNIGNFQRGNRYDIRSGVVIFNDAPYASAVHRSRDRKVFANAGAINSIKGKWGVRYESLVRVASLSALRRAGFNVK